MGVEDKAILKKNSVSGVAAGSFKNVRMGTFFSFLQKKKIPKMDNIFLPKKNEGKKKKCGLPTGFKNGHPLDRKQKFFLGWPKRRSEGEDLTLLFVS